MINLKDLITTFHHPHFIQEAQHTWYMVLEIVTSKFVSLLLLRKDIILPILLLI